MASAIGFDPYARCHILVGTVQNGIFRSTDGGSNWKHILCSTSITNISGFYFPSEGPIYVSTYGRGLWKLDINRSNPAVCLTLEAVPFVQEKPAIIHFLDGTKKPFTWPPPETKWDNRISFVIVRHGYISDLRFAGDSITGIDMAGGFIDQYDWQGKPIDLQIPNQFYPNARSLEFTSMLEKLQISHEKSQRIRGIVVADNQLAGLIIAEDHLPIDTIPIPTIEAYTKFSVAGMPLVQPGDSITIYGSGFVSSREKTASMIRLDNREVSKDLQMGENGSFKVRIGREPVSGPQEIIVEQRHGKKLIRATTTVLFGPGDEFIEMSDTANIRREN